MHAELFGNLEAEKSRVDNAFIQKNIRFNPLELRGKHGEWTAADDDSVKSAAEHSPIPSRRNAAAAELSRRSGHTGDFIQLWHGTSETNAKKITQEGLMSSQYKEDYDPTLTSRKDTARYWGAEKDEAGNALPRQKHPSSVLDIRIPRDKEAEYLHPLRHFAGYRALRKPVPPEMIYGYSNEKYVDPDAAYLDDAEKSYINASLVQLLPPEVAKVGAEGYIHGFICVRPPCGATQKGIAVPSSMFSDFDTERQRLVDEKMAMWFPDKVKVGPHGYVHGWIKEDPDATADVQAHQADVTDTAMRTEMSEPGSHGHAEELRSLAREASLHQQRNYTSLRGSREGAASLEQTDIGGGRDRSDIPGSPAAHALSRAADMVDRGQPSLARLHSGTIRDAASREAKGDPAFAARLSAAADKLDLLKPGEGMAATPPETGEFRSRTAAARRYAKKVRKELEAVEKEIW